MLAIGSLIYGEVTAGTLHCGLNLYQPGKQYLCICEHTHMYACHVYMRMCDRAVNNYKSTFPRSQIVSDCAGTLGL